MGDATQTKMPGIAPHTVQGMSDRKGRDIHINIGTETLQEGKEAGLHPRH